MKKIGFEEITLESNKYINAVLWNKIFKRELLNEFEISYPQQYEHDDAMFVYKYISVSRTYYGLNKALYNYVVGNKESIMGKVFTKNNKKNPFDFIFAWQNLYDFFEKNKTSKEWRLHMYKKHFAYICVYYKFLDLEQKQECFSIIQNFIKKNPELIENKYFNEVAGARNFEEISEIISRIKSQKISILEHIFSVKNTDRHKVLRILGFKIKVKR